MWKNSDSYDSNGYRDFLETIHEKNIPLHILPASGEKREIAGVNITVLPRPLHHAEQTKKNGVATMA